MIVQHTKTLNYTKPTDLFNYMKDYVLSAPRTEILEDYTSKKKIMVTDVLPLGEKDYDKDALDFATELGWEFTLSHFHTFTLYQDDSTCSIYDDVEKICTYIRSKRNNGYTTAFIGYKMEDVFAMFEANYSGTCVDALQYTK